MQFKGRYLKSSWLHLCSMEIKRKKEKKKKKKRKKKKKKEEHYFANAVVNYVLSRGGFSHCRYVSKAEL